MNDDALTIEVYSDVVCPWCYIGKRRLEGALEAIGRRDRAVVHWRPFQLNPTMPELGMDRRVYMETKFGSAQEIAAIHDRVAAVGRSVGIAFAFERIPRTPNTLAAHRVIQYAGHQGAPAQDRLVEALFRAYFVEGLNIGDHETLVTLSGQAGLDGEAVRRLLAGHEGLEAVREEEAEGRRLGIRGVPYFVFNGRQGLSGAQPVETLVAAITQAAVV